MNYDAIAAFEPREIRHRYAARDTMLYALGVGVGLDDPVGVEARTFAFGETDLQVLPSMATVLAVPGFYMREPRFGVSWQKILHGEQSIRLYHPLPTAADVRAVLTIDEVFDRGTERGASVLSRREIYDCDTGRHYATVRITSLLRGDGGQGGRQDSPPKPHPVPDSRPDLTVTLPTSAALALTYRLSGDYNPLHVDPEVAKAAGFAKPILHGLCTYGIAARAIIRACCPDRVQRLIAMDTRFSSPVFPGETIRVEIWHTGNAVSFRAIAVEREAVVLNNGFAELAPLAPDIR